LLHEPAPGVAVGALSVSAEAAAEMNRANMSRQPAALAAELLAAANCAGISPQPAG
jgi:hypothetical protein